MAPMARHGLIQFLGQNEADGFYKHVQSILTLCGAIQVERAYNVGN